ncbi:MAG: hypothetical protein Q7T80_02100 [Methanoregula sp.]|nr:hypothetical protein [Methanoregula sp.]
MKNIAAKPDAKSGYIILPASYCVFTSVNGKRIMNTHYGDITGPAADPDANVTAVRIGSGSLPEVTVERFSGIRSSGQYCSPMELTRTDLPTKASRLIRRRAAVHGMCR